MQFANALHLTRLTDLVSPAFSEFIVQRYGAQLFSGSDLDAINNWARLRTAGRIEQLLTKLDANSVCVLLNAIYFKAAWSERFDKRATRLEAFHLATGQVVQATTMHQQGYFQVLRARAYDAIRLPYRKSGIAMIVIMSAQDNRLVDIEAGLAAQSVAAIVSGLRTAQTTKIDLSLPSFKVDLGADLIPAFQDVGVKLAFDRSRADFSGVTGSSDEIKRIYISQIQHRAFLDVNEDGTEAAAATAVEFAARSTPAQPAVFKVDRPFLYLIADEVSGAILFIGRVMDPRSGTEK